MNVTTPPVTGSIGLLAVTITTSGDPKAVFTGVLWLLPLTIVIVNPLDSKAPMSTVPLTMRRKAALVGGDAGGNQGVIARVDGRAAGQQGHRLGRAAVIAQRCQQGVERLAMVPVRSEATQPELPSVSPIRLFPWEAKVPKTSGPLVWPCCSPRWCCRWSPSRSRCQCRRRWRRCCRRSCHRKR